MELKIAAISDTHYAESRSDSAIRAHIADVLLLRAVHRLNRFVKPDVTLLLGDVIDDPASPSPRADLERMSRIAALLESAVIAIPGNHDCPPDVFYQAFRSPGAVVDVKGVRFLPFVDPPEPEYNARRTESDMRRMESAASDHAGPCVAVQHVPLFPEGATDCPYHLTNAGQALAATQRSGIVLTVGGHYHPGFDLIQDGRCSFLAVPALCESPFPFLEIHLTDQGIRTIRHELRMPAELELADCHVHTPFAYCNHNMELAKAAELAEELGLAQMAFTEHSGQLYFDAETYWSGEFLARGVEGISQCDNSRMDEYWEEVGRFLSPRVRMGLEVDCDYRGGPVVREQDRRRAPFLMGAVHRLPELDRPRPGLQRACEEYLWILDRFLRCGIRVLAHPFRLFRRLQLEPPAELFRPTVRMLRESGVAAEVNFHMNEPPQEFVYMCIESGVKLTLGSDAHSLYEVGELAPHLELLRSLGYDEGISDIVAQPAGAVGGEDGS